MRTWLVLNVGDSSGPDAAPDCGADALLLDICGADRARARERARAFLLSAPRGAACPKLFARVAPVDGGIIDADLAALIPAAPDGVFLDGAQGGACLQRLSAKLAVCEAEAGLADGATKIVAFAAQTPGAVFGLGTYAGASRRLVGLALSPDDSTPAAEMARGLLLLGAAAAGVAAIDAPFPDLADAAGLAAASRAARRAGFAGKLALDAAQIGVIAQIFA